MTRHPSSPRLAAILAALVLLAGCGADGAPVRPGAAPSGVAFSGEARIGISTP